MLLGGKSAVVYGGGGAIGGAVARAFAREGASVSLAGRTRETLEEVAGEIRSAGGEATVAVVDALDEAEVEAHLDAVMERSGGIDVSFNAISIRDVQSIPLLEISREEYMSPVLSGTATHFLTARAAGRRMVGRGSGVILTLSASAVRGFFPGVHLGGFGVACTAIEALTKQVAAELGPSGVRAVCLRCEGIPQSWANAETAGWSAPLAEIETSIAERSVLGRVTTLDDVCNAAAFLASDLAGATTGTVFNLTSGTVID